MLSTTPATSARRLASTSSVFGRGSQTQDRHVPPDERIGVVVAAQLAAQPRQRLVQVARRPGDERRRRALLLALRVAGRLVDDAGIAEDGPDAHGPRCPRAGFRLEDGAGLQEAGGPVADHLQRGEQAAELLVFGRDLIVEVVLDGREDVDFTDHVGDRATIRLVRGVEVRLDEPRMERRSSGVDDARRLHPSRHLAVRAHGSDIPPRDGHGAVGDERAHVVHGDDVGVADEQVDRRRGCAPCHVTSSSLSTSGASTRTLVAPGSVMSTIATNGAR